MKVEHYTSSNKLYGILTSNQLHDYLTRLTVDAFVGAPSAQQAFYDLMEACHHATAGTGLDAFLSWAHGAPSLKDKSHAITQHWNNIGSDHGNDAFYLARELRLQGFTDLDEKLAHYNPRTVNQLLRKKIRAVREMIDAHRVLDDVAAMDGLHPYQVNSLITQIHKKTKIPLSELRDFYTLAVQSQQKKTIPWPHYTQQKNGTFKILGTYENFLYLLKRFNIQVRYNMMAGTIDVDYPGEQPVSYLLGNKLYLNELHSKARQVNFNIAMALMESYAKRRACEPGQHYHPVLDWIDAVEWDGLDRLTAVLSQFDLHNMTMQEARESFKSWLLVAMDALINPHGVSEPLLLVLFAPYEAGKTQFIQSLLPEAQFQDFAILDQRLPKPDKRHVDSTWARWMLSHWIAELVNFEYADLKNFKKYQSFFNARVDFTKEDNAVAKWRHRRTVFIASVHSVVETINRFPECQNLKAIQFKQFTRDPALDMRQVWAQALAMYHKEKGR